MFSDFLEAAVGMSDAELNEAVGVSELAMREHEARHAALLAVADARQIYRADGHHSLKGYLRATCNHSIGEAARRRKVAAVVEAVAEIGEALAAGRIGISQVLEFARIEGNPRIRQYLPAVAPILLERAEHESHDDFRRDIDQFMMQADLDGAFAHIASNIEHRNARVSEVGDTIDIAASGGDPLTAMKLANIFQHFVQREFERDVEARRAEFGDAADQYPLPRSAGQRRFDALLAIFERAYAAPDGGMMPEPVVNIVIDDGTLDAAFTRVGITMPDGDVLDLDDLDPASGEAIIADAAADPAAWLDRRCETTSGAAVHPLLVLQAAMTGHIRRVVVDSRGTVIDLGRKQRLFTGSARDAAKVLMRRCSHPGCSVPMRYADIDHIDEWVDGGRTDQHNSDIECRSHNRFKHRERWRTLRDPVGRRYSVRPDGTTVLPVGERPPDLSIDDLERAARARLLQLTGTV
ncbi:MAG: HNH endonuclease signature motif containing protein [Ilumatobacteraceae bacterium]